LEIGLRNAQRRERVDLPSLRRFLERLVELEPPGKADGLAVLFVSDMAAEVEAARSAGMQALLIDRDGTAGDVATLAEVLP